MSQVLLVETFFTREGDAFRNDGSVFPKRSGALHPHFVSGAIEHAGIDSS